MKLLLIENIEAVKKYYSSINDNDFYRLIALDPTYKENKDSVGKYGKWILNLFKKGNLDNEGHIRDILIRFEENKKYLKNKDINSFKSIEDLDDYMNNNDNYNHLTNRQELRQVQKKVHNSNVQEDADIVYEDNDWIVYIPKTYEASCKLGQGTTWCTASTSSDYYYKSYTKQGPLYININKHNSDEKYQFHFESRSYRDKNDELINLQSFFTTANNFNLFNFYKNKFDEKTVYNIITVKEFFDNNPKGIYTYDKSKVPDILKGYIKEIYIPNNITKIESEAFKKFTNLTYVTFEKGSILETIGDFAFYYCPKLKDITIPDSVVNIGRVAFFWCTNLKNIIIPDSVKVLGESAFEECANLTDVKLGNGITTIKKNTFRNTWLDNLVIPANVISIDEDAFYGCKNLTSITIPDSIKNIDYNAFYACTNLKKININSLESWCKIKFDTYDSNPLYYAHNLYLNDVLITDLVIPNDVTSIQHATFYNCNNLRTVIIPEGTTSIGNRSFAGCKNLTSITIPKSITDIGYDVFKNCKSLEEIIYKGTKEEFNNIEYRSSYSKDDEINIMSLIKFQPQNISQEESLTIKQALNQLRRLR